MAISIWRPGEGETGAHRVDLKRHVLNLNWSFTIVGLILVGMLGWWVTHSPIFAARDLTISGNRHLTREREFSSQTTASSNELRHRA